MQRLFAAIFLTLLALAAPAAAQTFPQLTGRVVDQADRRVRRLVVTPEATRRLDAVRVSYEHMMAGGLGDWPVDQVERLSSLITDLAAGLRATPAGG